MDKSEALEFIESSNKRLLVVVGDTGYPVEVSRASLAHFINNFIDDDYALYCNRTMYGESILFDARLMTLEERSRLIISAVPKLTIP